MLDLLISPAWAQAAPQTPGGLLGSPIVMMVFLLVLFYFMLIRPQMKRSKEMREMLGKLAKGDEVITSGGLAGVLRELGENYVTVEVADNVLVKLQKSAIVSVLPKGSLKAL
ncbi:MAG: preprotein translocase subunit YajC [Nevskiaceae bacterium]